MNGKVISCDYLIARTINNFNLPSSVTIKAIEWIGEGLGLMDILMNLQSTHTTITVTNNLSKLPCDIELIELMVCNNIELKPLTNKNFTIVKNEDNVYNYHGYSVNSGGYIHTPTIESGTIYVDYKRYPLDDRGYPMIPDVPEVHEALSMFLILRTVGNGYKHPVFTSYDKLSLTVLGYDTMGHQQARSLFDKARVAVSTPNAAEREVMSMAIKGIGSNRYVLSEGIMAKSKE